MHSLIFDYDGTLHDSIKIYAPAFRQAYAYLVSLKLAEERTWTDAEISPWLGFSSKDMWNSFLPELPQLHKDECSRIIGETMVGLIQKGKAQLYPHALTVLERLRRSGYHLIFLSNCKRIYMQAHRDCFPLDDIFSAFYCTEDFGFQPKYVIFETIEKDYPGQFTVIGDRFQDMEIAQKHHLPSIGCGYGYGEPWELSECSMLAMDITDIPGLLLHS
ncbi:MAG: HAD hydrolase-like protein [Lacrimispora sp.]